MEGKGDRKTGKVYLVGAGPGDPGLLTLRGRDCLEESDCVVYDYLANEKLLSYTRPGTERIFAGKHGGGPLMPQEEISRLLISRAREGKIVTRLKGGDPFIFGRGGEEAEALADAGVSFEIVPGVTAAIAVPAYAGIPLTHRDYASTVAFVTGYEDPEKIKTHVAWDKMALGADTLVVFMGLRTISFLVDHLIQNGRSPDTPVAVIRWGTVPSQETLTGTLEEITGKVEDAGWKPPAMIVVGDVVRLREKIRWFEKKPLFGRCIVVTRSSEQAPDLSRLLFSQGAEVVEFPALEFAPPDSWETADKAIDGLKNYAWILFTSVNGVRYFMERLHSRGWDTRSLGGARICAVGPKTAGALQEWGIRPDLVPTDYGSEGVIEAFRAHRVQGEKVLFPRAKEGREVLIRGLSELGDEVTMIPVYQSVRPKTDGKPILRMFREGKVHAVTFTSPATARNFVEMLGENEYKILFENVEIACISPVTAEAVQELGIQVTIVPPKATVESLAGAMADYFSKKRGSE